MENNFSIEFRIIIPFFNAEKFIGKCIDSIKSQTYKKFTVHIFDDCSSDNSFEVAKSFINDDERFFLKKNNKNYGALYNIVQGLNVRFKDDTKIVDIIIDGDDYLYTNDALQIIYFTYLKTNCLITYGTFIHLGGEGIFGRKYPLKTILNNSYRKEMWMASHLRTFRHDLWLKIEDSDLRDNYGNYYPTTGDLATMFPMLEMAGLRQECISDILYVYKNVNPICNHFTNLKIQQDNEKLIRNKSPYKPIEFKKIFC